MYLVFRFLIDYAFVILVFLLLTPLLLVVAVIIKFTSKGPIIFAQQRVGRHGKVFICRKFRSMYVGTQQAGTHEVSFNQVTPFGGFIRRTKIDELPQVINILCGELSLIGPRPSLPTQYEVISARENAGVLALKPGITGWAQINEIDMSEPERLAKYDRFYMDNQSILMDMRIIAATIFGRGAGDRVAKK